MPGRLKRSAVVVAAFAGFFYWGFMTAKHDPSLRDIVPFGEDPYDAVGSFARSARTAAPVPRRPR